MKMFALFFTMIATAVGLVAVEEEVVSSVCDTSFFSRWCAQWNIMDPMHKIVILAILGLFLAWVLIRLVRGAGCCTSGCSCGGKCGCK